MATTYITVVAGPLRRKLQLRGSNPAWTYVGELQLWFDMAHGDPTGDAPTLPFRNTLQNSG